MEDEYSDTKEIRTSRFNSTRVGEMCSPATINGMKSLDILKILCLLGFLLANPVSLACAQVMSPSLERHTFEIGCMYKWYERDFESSFIGRENWSSGAVYLRYGACRWATISFEGGVSTVHNDDFEGIDYRRYTIGGGLTVPCYRRADWQVEVASHYSEIFDHDRSENEFQKDVRDFVFAIQVERFFSVRDQAVIVWGGPAYVYDRSLQYPGGTYLPRKDDTSHNLGFVVGANAVLFERVNVLLHVVYADTFQPRLGAGIRF